MKDPDLDNPYYVGNYWLQIWERIGDNVVAVNVLKPEWPAWRVRIKTK